MSNSSIGKHVSRWDDCGVSHDQSGNGRLGREERDASGVEDPGRQFSASRWGNVAGRGGYWWDEIDG